MMHRLAEVAGKIEMSEATVSRVLNGKPGGSEATTGGSWSGACPPSW
ncbi:MULTISPECIES: hypothetical protein [Streptosporangium]|uniref:DNA-binding LacI/PurR family transcriptional regulator n=1 Tax=Streptosporangium brasiliense TaxID=47480 RepID=A0ABT9RF45_9ACTN|nr:hypothetical protein [Streptosporangium brasiliense]MDP9867903.1 DNA-binding LacI/PurR family transcriptional regulator [Streptosporangium brasiliense]